MKCRTDISLVLKKLPQILIFSLPTKSLIVSVSKDLRTDRTAHRLVSSCIIMNHYFNFYVFIQIVPSACFDPAGRKIT